jgi:tetratricopeptide (TPR) repeat protein
MATTQEQLIDHLDNTRLGRGADDMENQPGTDPETIREWSQLRLAVEGIRQAGLYEQIKSVKEEWLASRPFTAQVDATRVATITLTSQPAGPKPAESKPAGAILRSITRTTIRVAACLVILGGGAAIYKYTMTNSAGIFAQYCSTYDLNTSRGATATTDEMDQAYKNKNWAAVTELFKKKKAKNNKTYFLAGMADLESKKYDDAIGMFQQVMAANSQSGSDYFEDEAEFYLAMSWLARNDVKEAMPLLDKIRADKNHLYHDVVVKMSTLDLLIAGYKDLN